MTFCFPCARPTSPRCNYFPPGICAVLACLFTGAGTAEPVQLDPAFGVGGKVSTSFAGGASRAAAVRVLDDGKIYVVGYCAGSADTDFCLRRYDDAGAVDNTFGSNGVVLVPRISSKDEAVDLLIQPSGKIVIVGTCVAPGATIDICAARFSVVGTLDTTFGNGGSIAFDFGGINNRVARAITVGPSGAIFISAFCRSSPCLVKLTESGAIDASFGNAGAVEFQGSAVLGLTADRSGGMLIASTCQSPTTPSSMTLCLSRRSESDGSLIASFGNQGTVAVNFLPYGGFNGEVAQGPTGDIFVAEGESNTVRVAKLSENGNLVQSFGTSGIARIFSPTTSAKVTRLLIDAQNRAVVAINCSVINPSATPTIWFKRCAARWTIDGRADRRFGVDGLVTAFLPQPPLGVVDLNGETADGAILDLEGRLLLVGGCGASPDFSSAMCLARLKGSPYNPLTCALNADANQTIDPATDAMLITRYLFGVRGDALKTGALGQNPTRTGQALET